MNSPTLRILNRIIAVRLLDATWSEGRDITSDTVICQIADGIGLNGQELLAKARAIQAGVFGVPSFVVDGEIFWGNDRLPLLNAYLQGRLPADKSKLEEILSRPRAADRSRR